MFRGNKRSRRMLQLASSISDVEEDDHRVCQQTTDDSILAFLTIISGTCAGVALIRRCRDTSERARWSVFHRTRDPSISPTKPDTQPSKSTLKLPTKIPSWMDPNETNATTLTNEAPATSSTARAHWAQDNRASTAAGPSSEDHGRNVSFQRVSGLISEQRLDRLKSTISRIGLAGVNPQKSDVFEATVGRIDLSERRDAEEEDDDNISEPPELQSHKPSMVPEIKEHHSSGTDSSDEGAHSHKHSTPEKETTEPTEPSSETASITKSMEPTAETPATGNPQTPEKETTEPSSETASIAKSTEPTAGTPATDNPPKKPSTKAPKPDDKS